jgi:hypothetical protein
VIANQINGWLAAAQRAQTPPQYAAFKQTLKEAAAAANRHGGLSLTSSLALFSSPQTARAEADAILANLGLQ